MTIEEEVTQLLEAYKRKQPTLGPWKIKHLNFSIEFRLLEWWFGARCEETPFDNFIGVEVRWGIPFIHFVMWWYQRAKI